MQNNFMKMAVEEARRTMTLGYGGPFGAVIVKDGKLIAVGSNHVLKNNDPTEHAEINVIRKACKQLNTYDLSGCELYATGYPCPMCLSAIIWSNIKKVYYGCTPIDADAIGFRDDFIYKFIEQKMTDKNVLQIVETDRESCIMLFNEYSKNESIIY